jgi:hypothetical protein
MQAISLSRIDLPRVDGPAEVVIDLPPPISVNKLRRVDWQGMKAAKAWRKLANSYLMMLRIRPTRIRRFEITIVLDETLVSADCDNTIKMVVDYLCAVEVIEDDSPRHMRRLVVEWGEAPLGCRVTVRPYA